MRMKLCLTVAGVALLLAALPVAAHHAFAAEFDSTQPVKVKGTIAKMEWSNPHAWLYVDVKEPDGKVVNWRFELGAPNALIRLGWKTDSVPVGVEVQSKASAQRRWACRERTVDQIGGWPRTVQRWIRSRQQ